MSKGNPVLLATTIFVLQEGGNYKQFHRGEAVPGLNEEQVDRLTKCGALGSASDLAPEADEVDLVEDAPSSDGGKPAEDATKADLIEWLVDNAVDADGVDYTTSKLQPLNKAALWDLINAVED